MSRTSFDYIIKKLNPHGPTEGLGGEPDLTTEDVYAALGYGNLADAPYRLGQTIYAPNRRDEMVFTCIGTRWVDALFHQHGWDAKKALGRRISDHLRTNKGSTREQSEKYAIARFKVALVRLALYELIRDNLCHTCNGTGSAEYRKCHRCKGAGRKTLPYSYRYDFLGISEEAWKTWSTRYSMILKEFQFWRMDYEEHAQKQTR